MDNFGINIKKKLSEPFLAILFRPFGFIAPRTLNYLAFQSFNLSVPDESYSRNASCALNLISTFLLIYLFILTRLIYYKTTAKYTEIKSVV